MMEEITQEQGDFYGEVILLAKSLIALIPNEVLEITLKGLRKQYTIMPYQNPTAWKEGGQEKLEKEIASCLALIEYRNRLVNLGMILSSDKDIIKWKEVKKNIQPGVQKLLKGFGLNTKEIFVQPDKGG